jgi:hypothetical protein
LSGLSIIIFFSSPGAKKAKRLMILRTVFCTVIIQPSYEEYLCYLHDFHCTQMKLKIMAIVVEIQCPLQSSCLHPKTCKTMLKSGAGEGL